MSARKLQCLASPRDAMSRDVDKVFFVVLRCLQQLHA